MLVKHDKYSLEKQLHNGISCFLHSDFEKQKEDFCRASIRTTKLFLTQFFCSYCQQCLLWVKINRRPSVQAHIPHHSVSLSLLCLSLVTLTLIFLFSQFPVSWPGWAGSGHRLVAAGHATGAHCSHPTLNIPQSPVLTPHPSLCRPSRRPPHWSSGAWTRGWVQRFHWRLALASAASASPSSLIWSPGPAIDPQPWPSPRSPATDTGHSWAGPHSRGRITQHQLSLSASCGICQQKQVLISRQIYTFDMTSRMSCPHWSRSNTERALFWLDKGYNTTSMIFLVLACLFTLHLTVFAHQASSIQHRSPCIYTDTIFSD